MRKPIIFGLVSLVSAVALSMPVRAVTVVPNADFTAATDLNNIKVDGGVGFTSTLFSTTTDFGQGTITFSSLPTMNATAQESGTNTVTAGLIMHYFFMFVSNVTEVLPSQPIFITNGSVSGSGSGGVSAGVNAVTNGPLAYSLGGACIGTGCSLSASFSKMTQPSIAAGAGLVQTNAIYEITMNAGVEVGQGESATAFLDPQITFDQSVDVGVTLELSAGVGN